MDHVSVVRDSFRLQHNFSSYFGQNENRWNTSFAYAAPENMIAFIVPIDDVACGSGVYRGILKR